MKNPPNSGEQLDNDQGTASILVAVANFEKSRDQNPAISSTAMIIPAFERDAELTQEIIRARFTEACVAWLTRSPSLETRSAYARELDQFLRFVGIPTAQLQQLTTVRPHQVAAWRDLLRDRGLSNTAIVRKITVLRSLYSYLQTYGFTGANPAHSDFVQTPAVPRDGKTVGLSPQDCRRLLDAPDAVTPQGVRDRAMFAVLAYTGCRVGELTRFPGFRVSPAAFLIDAVENNRTPPDWLYAHEKLQERRQWEEERASASRDEQDLRGVYDQERAAALQGFLASAEGRQKYESAFAAYQAFYKTTDPHRFREAAHEAAVARLERFDFKFPDYAVWALTRQPTVALT